MLRIAPPSPSSIFGITMRESRNADVTLKWKAASNIFSLVRSAGRGGVPPALFTSRSMRPNSFQVASTTVFELRAIVDVAGNGEHAPAGVLANHRGGRFEIGRIARRDRHVGAGLRERARDAAADALGTARHDGDAVGDAKLIEDHRWLLLGGTRSLPRPEAPRYPRRRRRLRVRRRGSDGCRRSSRHSPRCGRALLRGARSRRRRTAALLADQRRALEHHLSGRWAGRNLGAAAAAARSRAADRARHGARVPRDRGARRDRRAGARARSRSARTRRSTTRRST